MLLHDEFVARINTYTADQKLAEQYWLEIEKEHNGKKRFYHNLTHLENLLRELMLVKNQIADWDCVVFAIAYHDIIYNPLKQNNEEKSAALARERLLQTSLPAERIAQCVDSILATKGHVISASEDINLFTDADLSILGAEAAAYERYAANVRKEYAYYPDLLYKPGRKKVLQYFLAMEKIFKTALFFEKYENSARLNLRRELESL
jgi:predicted metal-dependent HD superfamily phosphohydrolase